MPTMLISSRRARRATFALLAGLSSVLGACADGAGVADPGSGADRPARVAVAASVSYSAAAVAEVRVTAAYLLQGGSSAQLSVQNITLSEAPSQQVPISLDLASCLRDTNRAGLGGNAASADECVVRLELQLILDGVAVDRQVVGPLSLRPGQTSTVSQPVALTDIAEVRVTGPAANVVAPGQPLRVEVARTMALTAQVLDRAGRAVTGRTPQWTSSAPSVATVSATGVVTAIAPGTARIAADVGTRQGGVDVRVVPQPQVLTVVSAGFTGTGTVSSQPAGINCAVNGSQTTGACTFTFPGDIQVVLTAAPATGTELVGWAGDCGGAQGSSCTVSMAQARTAGIVFRALRALTVTAVGTGTGIITSDNGGISCQAALGVTAGTCGANFVEGARVALSATPTGVSSFGGWTGDCAGAGTSTTCVVTMEQARNVTARFNAPVTVALAATGTGSGTVVSTPSGLSCQLLGTSLLGQCNAGFAEGTVVTLTANASGSSVFRGWTGACAASQTASCTFTVTSATTSVGVRFEPPVSLVVVPAGTGLGQVLSTPSGIICVRSSTGNSGTCSLTAVSGTTITLRAEVGALSTFVGWTGPCSGTGDCVVTMDEARTVGAVFNRVQVPISIILNGPGSGTLALNGTTVCTLTAGQTQRLCSALADLGSTATFTASPANNGTVQFSGACNTLALNCQFIVGVNAALSATFGPPGNIVSVSAAANATGTGTVVTSGGGLDCELSVSSASGICELRVPTNTTLFLSAVADGSTSLFDGWGGACAAFGLSDSCSLTPTTNLGVTARFTLGIPVTVSIGGTGDGAVTLSSGNRTVVCERVAPSSSAPTVCSIPVRPGESVTFAAEAYSSSSYSGLSSPCGASPSQLSCTVTGVGAAFTVSTTFNQISSITSSVKGAAPTPPPPTRRRPGAR